MTSRTQIAAWNTAAMVKRNWMVASTIGGAPA
jgi:hypothetical protein